MKNSEKSQGKNVQVEFGNERRVTVNKQVAYQQNKWGVGGSFQGEFSELA